MPEPQNNIKKLHEELSAKLDKLSSSHKDKLTWPERDQVLKELQAFIDQVFNI